MYVPNHSQPLSRLPSGCLGRQILSWITTDEATRALLLWPKQGVRPLPASLQGTSSRSMVKAPVLQACPGTV